LQKYELFVQGMLSITSGSHTVKLC